MTLLPLFLQQFPLGAQRAFAVVAFGFRRLPAAVGDDALAHQAIDVDPQARLGGVGTQLLQAISARFKRIGVRKLRTIVALENTLILSFFRAQGMMAGPLIALEMDLDP